MMSLMRFPKRLAPSLVSFDTTTKFAPTTFLSSHYADRRAASPPLLLQVNCILVFSVDPLPPAENSHYKINSCDAAKPRLIFVLVVVDVFSNRSSSQQPPPVDIIGQMPFTLLYDDAGWCLLGLWPWWFGHNVPLNRIWWGVWEGREAAVN